MRVRSRGLRRVKSTAVHDFAARDSGSEGIAEPERRLALGFRIVREHRTREKVM